MPSVSQQVLAILLTAIIRLDNCAAAELQQDDNYLTRVLNGATSSFKGIPELPMLDDSIDEKRVVYYHDQLVAVVDYANAKLIYCELIEVYEPSELKETLVNLTALYSLRPGKISFENMVKLMGMCDKLDDNPARAISFYSEQENKKSNSHPLFVGIVPGTKWCGTGDIARSYHDLGSRTNVDRCCRRHDLCPVKIRAYKSRYNLKNQSLFSRSHCNCDKIFYSCLKSINHVSATIIGNLYFNVGQLTCIEQDPSINDKNTLRFVSPKKMF